MLSDADSTSSIKCAEFMKENNEYMYASVSSDCLLTGECRILRNSIVERVSSEWDAEQCQWFWGSIGQVEVTELMTGLRDGCFLVRYSSDRNPGADYTLSIRINGNSRMLRIFKKNNQFGFREHCCQFSSVADLIDHYQTHKIKLNNRSEGAILTYPILRSICNSTRPANHDILVGSLSNLKKQSNILTLNDEELLDQFRQSISMNELATKLLEQFIAQRKSIDRSLDEISHKTKSVTCLQKWSKDHAELIMNQYSTIPELRQSQRAGLDEINRTLGLHDRALRSLAQQRLNVDNKRNDCSCAISDRLADRRNLLLFQERLALELVNRGLSVDSLVSSDFGKDSFFQQLQKSLFLNNPINNRKLWYREVSRAESFKLLKNQAEGTFLVRPSETEPNNFVVVLVIHAKVEHCRVYSDGVKIGFRVHELLFENLEQMINNYHYKNMIQYNPKLINCLKTPIEWSNHRKISYLSDFTQYIED